MAELLLLRDVFERISGKERVNLRALFDGLDNPIMAPYTGDFESFKNIFYRLDKEGVIKGQLDGDVLIIEAIKQGSHVHDAIDRLIRACRECKTAEEFGERVHTSELNRLFMDDEEIKSVFFLVGSATVPPGTGARDPPGAAGEPAPGGTKAPGHAPRDQPGTATSAAATLGSPSRPDNDPLSTPVVTTTEERAKEDVKIEEMRGVFEKKVDRLKAMTKDYVETLLGTQNEMDLVVLRFLLNDLLPLRSLNLNTDSLIIDAVRERNLPFVLDGTVYKRTGPRVKTTGPELRLEERTRLQRFGIILSRGLMDARFIGMLALQRLLESEKFEIPEGETVESLLEKTIRQGYFKGHVDLVEQRVYRAKTEAEQYQEEFLNGLNKLSREIAADASKLSELKEAETRIPPSLEVLLLSPEKRGITGVLDKAVSVSQNLQDFIMAQVQVGKQVSVADLSKQLRDHVHKDHVDVPYAIDDDVVERILEKMVEDRKISGYFADQSNFFRKR